MSPPRNTIAQIVTLALDEDLGRGDLTTEACVSASAQGYARLCAREALVSCGAAVATEVFAQVDPRVTVEVVVPDGSAVEPGAVILELRGPSRALLEGERVALNFMQRLSGIATLTRKHVAALPPASTTRITDTRKTTPGLRALERYAVRCGGGHNHREDLSSAILIKDNHVAAAGGVNQAITLARARAPHTCRIECEVDTLSQLDEALAARADVILLDNFDNADIATAVARVAGRAILEVSGSITLERIPSLAKLGVDLISFGKLTHSAPAVDLGLDWVSQ